MSPIPNLIPWPRKPEYSLYDAREPDLSSILPGSDGIIVLFRSAEGTEAEKVIYVTHSGGGGGLHGKAQRIIQDHPTIKMHAPDVMAIKQYAYTGDKLDPAAHVLFVTSLSRDTEALTLELKPVIPSKSYP